MFRNGKYFTAFLMFLSACLSQSSEEGQTAIPSTGLRIAFYNVENLFDTKDDPATQDEEFLPDGSKHWTKDRYQLKLKHLAEVIAAMDYPVILGVAEVENEQVLKDLISQKSLEGKGYRILHDDSPDARGIDVALLYRAPFFTPFMEESLELNLGSHTTTREILKVGGTLGSPRDTLYFLVNHWPSRGGGLSKTAPRRKKAAALARASVDELLSQDSKARIIVMGDFNDEPTNESLFKVLEANGKEETLDQNDLFNPMYALQRQRKGSYRFRDKWNMLDQIILSQSLLSSSNEHIYYRPESARIFDDEMLLQQNGKYAGHLNRTFAGDKYLGGYSDHLPVYIELVVR